MSNRYTLSYKKSKHDPVQRPPLQELNKGVSTTSSGRSTSSISSSIEAPNGCLSFFLSNSKTPLSQKHKLKSKLTVKSAPNAKTRSTFSRSCKNSDENYPPKPKKKKKELVVSSTAPKSKLLRRGNEFGMNLSDSDRGLKKCDNAGEVFDHLHCTSDGVDSTPVSKLACGSVLNCADYNYSVVEKGSSSGTTKTPPVQPSVSPELLRGSSVLDSYSTKTPCYGAGHVVSGLTDKRKCRPKGVLTVGVGLHSSESNIEGDVVVGSDDSSGHFIRMLTGSRPSLIPLPVEASMSWHLSPCNEEDASDSASKLSQKGNSADDVTPDLRSLTSSPDEHATDLCYSGGYTDNLDSDITRRGRLTKITLLSPRRLSQHQVMLGASSAEEGMPSSSPVVTPTGKAVQSQEVLNNDSNWVRESSPLSIGSLSSGNVMQTPKSESSSEIRVFPAWLDVKGSGEHDKETAVESLTEVLRLQSLSPKRHKSHRDPLGLSSQFTDLSSPSTSVDPYQHIKTVKKHDSWIYGSTFEDMEQSETRISWREGLVSQIFKMDDLDCCRFLSDEDIDVEGSSEDQLKGLCDSQCKESDRISPGGLRAPEFLDQEPPVGSRVKGRLSSSNPNSCAESICTDGGGLVASGDSDWTICYKNQLFDV